MPTTAKSQNPFAVDEDPSEVVRRSKLATVSPPEPQKRARPRGRPRQRAGTPPFAMGGEASDDESFAIESTYPEVPQPRLRVHIMDTKAGSILEDIRRTLEAARKGKLDGEK